MPSQLTPPTGPEAMESFEAPQVQPDAVPNPVSMNVRRALALGMPAAGATGILMGGTLMQAGHLAETVGPLGAFMLLVTVGAGYGALKSAQTLKGWAERGGAKALNAFENSQARMFAAINDRAGEHMQKLTIADTRAHNERTAHGTRLDEGLKDMHNDHLEFGDALKQQGESLHDYGLALRQCIEESKAAASHAQRAAAHAEHADQTCEALAKKLGVEIQRVVPSQPTPAPIHPAG